MAEINTTALREDISKYLKTYARSYAKGAADAGPKLAKNAIQAFYDSYNPQRYLRVDNLKRNSFSRYYHDNGNVVYGGVRIHSDAMNDYAEGNWDKFQVASETWLRGRHGYIYTFPPVSMVKIALGQLSTTLQKKAEKEALNQKYNVLTFL